MLVYAPATMVGDRAGRRAELLPTNLRLLARGLVGGAFCWDQNGQPKKNWSMLRTSRLIQDLGLIGIVCIDVVEDEWLNANNIMGGVLEAPWATTVEDLVVACNATIDALIDSSPIIQSVYSSTSVDNDVCYLIDSWQAISELHSNARFHYLRSFDIDQATMVPAWLINNTRPNIDMARTFLAQADIDQDQSLTIADDLHSFLCCKKVVDLTN